MSKQKLHSIIRTSVWGVISIILIIAFIVGISIASTWDRALSGYFGSVGGGSTGSGLYEADDTTQEDIDATAAEISAQIVKEGTVLLKNDNNALPVSKGSKVSVFGVTSNYWLSSQTISSKTNSAFTTALTDAGLEINTSLRSLYKSNAPSYGTGSSMGGGSTLEDWTIDELEIDKYTSSITSTYSNYNDAAFVVLSRGNSEGSDVPMYMGNQTGGSDDESYMSLSQNERDLLEHVTSYFDTVIVIINSAGAMDMAFLDDYDIDGLIWVTGTGDVDLTVLGQLIVGDADFSGRLVDTYVYDNFDNPAVQNFGDYRYVNSDGSLTGYSYVNYAESIYVGYKYYETRYEDAVMKSENAGNYDYSSTVAFPFGYGLSYTSYEWSDFSVAEDSDTFTVSVTVTNTGDCEGKEVVEIYYQSPYTDYDKENGIEKASVNLIGYKKTGLLGKGDSETVTITIDKEDLASWDSSYSHDSTQGAYVLDAGDWYITAASNAHEAVNNILGKKNYTIEDGMTENGDSSMVYKFRESTRMYITTSATGATYKNNFSDVQLDDADYLTRSNWSMVESGLTYYDGIQYNLSSLTTIDGKTYTHTLSSGMESNLSATGWASSGNPNDPSDTSVYPDITTGATTDLSLSDMTGLDYDDEKWDELLNSLSLSDMNSLYGYGGYGTIEITSIDKPATEEYDGPAEISNLFSGEESYNFPVEILMASTWNTELLEKMGSCIGDQCLIDGVSGWYAPAMNTHRTAFGGRNFEYYSEDGYLAGTLAAAEVSAVQSKGVYVYIKHFAMNDQETNRGANGRYAVFATEQAMREIYLKPFQIAVEDGDAHGVMASMNRIGYRYSITSYSLLTETLRNEWGFTGIVITDYISSLSSEDAEAGIAAGLDLQLITFQNNLSESSLQLNGVQYMLRQATHNILYTQANSLVMNGYSSGFAVYKLLLIALGIVIAIYIAISGYLVLKYSWFKKAKDGKARAKLSRVDFIIAIAAGAVLAVLLVIVAVWFFTTALPALQQAFTL